MPTTESLRPPSSRWNGLGNEWEGLESAFSVWCTVCGRMYVECGGVGDDSPLVPITTHSFRAGAQYFALDALRGPGAGCSKQPPLQKDYQTDSCQSAKTTAH